MFYSACPESFGQAGRAPMIWKGRWSSAIVSTVWTVMDYIKKNGLDRKGMGGSTCQNYELKKKLGSATTPNWSCWRL